MAVYTIFPYSNTTYIHSYFGPLSLWDLTRMYPRGTNAMGPGRRTLVTGSSYIQNYNSKKESFRKIPKIIKNMIITTYMDEL
jgi:hypothetical protein